MDVGEGLCPVRLVNAGKQSLQPGQPGQEKLLLRCNGGGTERTEIRLLLITHGTQLLLFWQALKWNLKIQIETLQDLLDRFNIMAKICIILPVLDLTRQQTTEDNNTDENDENDEDKNKDKVVTSARLPLPRKSIKTIKSNEGVALVIKEENEKGGKKKETIKQEIKNESEENTQRSLRATRSTNLKRQPDSL